jgi:hypothetical protein
MIVLRTCFLLLLRTELTFSTIRLIIDLGHLAHLGRRMSHSCLGIGLPQEPGIFLVFCETLIRRRGRVGTPLTQH